MKILFKFPSRSRPEKFFRAIANLQEKINSDNYIISATLDVNDRLMTTEAVKTRLAGIKNLEITWGRSRGKIHAVNRNVPIYAWDILVLLSDDMRLIAKGFDELIREDFKKAGSLDHVIYYSDGFTKGIVSFPVMGRTWFENYGYIYNPVYLSLFCDEELYIVAERLGKLFISGNDIVRHDHPQFVNVLRDAQLMRTESFYRVDKRTFENRRRNNFR